MKNILMILLLSIFTSCDSDGNNGSSEGSNIDTGVAIFLKNSEGINLIDTPNYLSSNYKIYYLENGSVNEVYDGNMDAPRNFWIDYESISINMRLGLNASALEENPTTYIKWNETDTDTIKTHYSRGSENEIDFVICDKVWLNGELVWDQTSQPGLIGREITIIK